MIAVIIDHAEDFCILGYEAVRSLTLAMRDLVFNRAAPPSASLIFSMVRAMVR